MADKPRFWRLILFASTHSQCDVTTCDSRSKYSHLRSSNSLLLAVTRKALTRGRTLVTFSSCDLEFRSMTLTSEGDLESVKLNQQAKYVGHRSSSSKYIVRICRHTQTRPIALPEPLKWSVAMVVGKRNMQYISEVIISLKCRDSLGFSAAWTWCRAVITGVVCSNLPRCRETASTNKTRRDTHYVISIRWMRRRWDDGIMSLRHNRLKLVDWWYLRRQRRSDALVHGVTS